MSSTRIINVVGVHCGGEVCDVITGGVLDVPGKSMYDKMRHFWEKEDHIRQLLLNEPRGSSAMCMNLVLPPCNPEADAGFIIMEHEEYPPMSGANTVATTTALLETGMIRMREPSTTVKLDTPAGLVTVEAECEAGKCKAVQFFNVPAFVFGLDIEVKVPGLGDVKVDIAYGGMIYVLVDAASVGLKIQSEAGAKLVEVGERIKKAVQEQTDPVHPENPGIRGVTILEFTEPLSDVGDAKAATNTVVVSPGRLDRSPCGTGTCARLAVLHARGQLAKDQAFHHRSVIGTEFIGRVHGTTKVGQYDAVFPSVKGSAWMTSLKQVLVHPTDPFPEGFRVGDKWHLAPASISTFKEDKCERGEEDKCERGDSSVPEYEEASNVGSIHEQQDDVFGEISEGGPNYRNVGWLGTVALMMKTMVGLGVLSVPATFDALGLIPGVICLCTVAAITTWSDYMIGVFKLRHRQVYGIEDVGQLLFGRVGRYFFSGAYILYWIFVAGSGMLSVSIGLNSLSTHGACTAIFVAIAAVVGGSFASIRTLGRLSWLAWIGLVCILTALFTMTIAVGVQGRPADAPDTGEWVPDYKLIGSPTFAEGTRAVSSLIFAYAGTPAFFNIVSEMRDQRLYTRSLLICQSGVTITYITIGVVVYYFCGSYVASPALGSAGPTMKKVSYGLALPGLWVTTMLVIHLPSKALFIRFLRGSKHLTSNSMIHWAVWLGCTSGVTISAYVIASAIPVFDGLVSLIGALLGTLLAFQPYGCMWLYDNWSQGRKEPTVRWALMSFWSVFVIATGCFMMVAGTYGSVVGIMETYKESGGSAAWSCADNSNSV